VKEVVLPFLKFKNVLPVLGPEMRSTGESMGIDVDPYLAYYKAELGANVKLPKSGTVLLIGEKAGTLASEFLELGFSVSRKADSGPYHLLVDTDHTKELRKALESGVPYITTLEAARWTLKALQAAQSQTVSVNALQTLAEANFVTS
jgi:carbamoyl-phosphate synthase large subunit